MNNFAEDLERTVEGIDEIRSNLKDTKNGYLSMDTYGEVLYQLNEMVINSYYEGNEEKTEYYIDKCSELLVQMRAFNQQFGL